MRVVWTDQAFLPLVEIEDYVARDNPKAAERRTDRLIARAEGFADDPHLGRILPELPGSNLSELVEGRYRIVYRVRDGCIDVLTVFEG